MEGPCRLPRKVIIVRIGPNLQRCRGLAAIGLLLGSPLVGAALDHVAFTQGGIRHQVTGRMLVEAQDGGLLIEGQDHVIWAVQPDELHQRRHDEVPFTPLDRAQLTERLLDELPEGFRAHDTAHYLIMYNTSRAYAQWSGALFERLHRAFFNYWEGLNLALQDAPPLVAVVLRDKPSYVQYSRGELGDATEAIIGYYSLKTNRITTYDLTGIEELGLAGGRINSLKHINRLLSQPAAERTVATVIHEATHQLAFNSGLQTRFADNPLWLSEGLAIYFESPDLNSQRGWRQVGSLNRVRLQQLRGYLPRRPENSLASLITSDARFRQPRQADDAYAEAWALCYYLIRSRPEQFAQYLRQIGSKPVLAEDGAERRLQQFQQAFQTDLPTLDAEFIRACWQWR